MSPSQSATLTQSPSVTATPTPSLTLTVTPTLTPSATLTASPTLTLSVSETASPTVTPTKTASPTVSATLTPSPTPTQSPSQTPSKTATATAVPQPYHLVLSVYNSAGERVRKLFEGASAGAPGGIEVHAGTGPGGAPALLASVLGAQGLAASAWLGDNDNGQALANGMYYFKLDVADAFGSVSSYAQGAPLIFKVPADRLAIYNSAGELVRELPLTAYPGGITDFRVSGGKSFELSDAQGGTHAMVWDGNNALGAPAASGSYTVTLIHSEAGSRVAVKSGSLILLQGPGSSAADAVASAVIGPNPLPAGAAAWRLSYAVPLRGRAVVKLYSLAGELVALADDGSGSGSFELAAPALAEGIYLASFEICDGPVLLARRIIKLAAIK